MRSTLPGRTVKFKLSDFSGGEASIFPISAMPQKFSELLQNCIVSAKSGVEKIYGYTAVNTSSCSAVLNNGFEYKKADGTTIHLCSGGGKVFKVDGTSLTAIKTGLNAAAVVRFAQMENLCIMVNGVDAPMKYDGTTVSALGGTPPATAFKAHVHKGRVWMIEKTNKLLASHSALNDSEDYTTASNAGYIDFQFIIGKGDELVDIASFFDLLVFFFKNHIVIYSGTNPTSSGDFSLQQIIEGVGLMGTGGCMQVGNDLALIHNSGIKSLKQVVAIGSLDMGDLSEKNDPAVQDILSSSSLQQNFSMGHYPAKGIVLIQLGTMVLIYSYVHKSWSRIVGSDIQGMFNTNAGALYLCGTNYLYSYGSTYGFNGSAITIKWAGSYLALSKTGARCTPTIAEILCAPVTSNINMTLQLKYDLQNSPAEDYTSFIIGSASAAVDIDAVTDFDAISPLAETVVQDRIRVPLFGSGETVQMIFSNTSTLGPIEINSITLQARVGG